jgi:hypothetical protein
MYLHCTVLLTVHLVIVQVPSVPPMLSHHPSITIDNNQSVAPDGPSMSPPIKKETWVAGKQEGQAGSPSYRQLG